MARSATDHVPGALPPWRQPPPPQQQPAGQYHIDKNPPDRYPPNQRPGGYYNEPYPCDHYARDHCPATTMTGSTRLSRDGVLDSLSPAVPWRSLWCPTFHNYYSPPRHNAQGNAHPRVNGSHELPEYNDPELTQEHIMRDVHVLPNRPAGQDVTKHTQLTSHEKLMLFFLFQRLRDTTEPPYRLTVGDCPVMWSGTLATLRSASDGISTSDMTIGSANVSNSTTKISLWNVAAEPSSDGSPEPRRTPPLEKLVLAWDIVHSDAARLTEVSQLVDALELGNGNVWQS
ncbi:hypothetical protein FACUT_1353 [Fusarium acutatum]|uniref:Uncharacterized protein n=1 Tax=Fusarium acutatum TaxID=78861 RepID=A0A8H4NM68_9HYPO|nr:hypothetical protein FACUT_1353 [Fusarium acutatum]